MTKEIYIVLNFVLVKHLPNPFPLETFACPLEQIAACDEHINLTLNLALYYIQVDIKDCDCLEV